MKTLFILFAMSLAAKAQTQAWNVIERARAQYRASQHCDDLGQRTAVLALARANKLTRANLSNLCLTQIDLRDSNLSYANFSQSNLEGAILDKAHLGFVQFRAAQLTGASFKGALIVQTSFANANLENAGFEGARIVSADLGGVKQYKLSTAQSKQTCFTASKGGDACFFFDKPISAGEIAEMNQTWMGKNWRRWRDGKCTLAGSPNDKTCFDAPIH
ncbi:MAG TPA: pentapeptide repeat-containing protein [Bryobacteraceae bacterium]